MEGLLNIVRQVLYYGSFALFAVSIGMVVFYFIRLSATKDYKARYDFINKSEKNTLWYSSLTLIIATGMLITSILATEWLYVFVGVFVSFMFGMILGVVIFNYLQYYYPTLIEKRLQALRYKPRISSAGNPMKLLSEAEEDVYLDEGMQAEENIFSVDYDVWIDEKTEETKIEKYKGHLHAEKSPTCGYYTLRVVKEEILESPTEEKEGTLVKYYECSYTGYKTKKIFNIARLKKTPKEAGRSFAPMA
ncbi:MAG: hypothetical protein ACLFUB_18615 [Cyclobacteriaceae bacterium]